MNSPEVASRAGRDPEKDNTLKTHAPVQQVNEKTYPIKLKGFLYKLSHWGVEIRGVEPVPIEEKTNDNYLGMLWFWTSMLCNFLPLSAGMVGTLSFGLSLRDAALVIIFFNLLCFAFTSWASLLGVRLGFRQMIHARYAYGLYCICLVILFNLTSIVGFTMIAGVISGQTLAAVNDDGLSVSVGIILSGLIGLVVSFVGYRILHQLNNWLWIVTLICIVITAACGGGRLSEQVQQPAAAASTLLTYGCLIIGFSLTLIGIMSDFTVYYRPDAPGVRLFWYILLGQYIPTVLLMILGAAIGGAVPNIPSWTAANESYSVGGVVTAILREKAGNFGRFIAILLAFSLIGNIAASMYSVSLNFQMLIPPLVNVPRALFSVVTTAIVILVGIEAAHNFFHSLENFLGLISYWPGCYCSVIVIEHLWFRKNKVETYEEDAWQDRKKLPSGLAALGASLLSLGLIIPCIGQIWYTGPIAETTGDIGFEVALVVSAICYFPFRSLEIKVQGHL